MPRRPSIAPRRAPVERAQPGRLPIRFARARSSSPKLLRSSAALERISASVRSSESIASLLACRPAAHPSDRRPPVILYSAILWGVLSQALRLGAHGLVTIGGVNGWRLYGFGDAAGGDRRHVYGKCCGRSSRRDKLTGRVSLNRVERRRPTRIDGMPNMQRPEQHVGNAVEEARRCAK